MKPWLAWLPLLLLACSGEERGNTPEAPLEWVEHAPRHARSYTLLRYGTRSRVLVFGDQDRKDTLAVVELGSGPSGSVRSASRFSLAVPLRRIALLSTTHASYLSALGAADRIRSMAYLDHVRDTTVLRFAAEGSIRSLGPAENPDRELLLAQDPDVLFLSPFGGLRSGVVPGGGIPVVPICEYLERTPLGRAEWVRFFGLLLGLESRADSLFDAIEERYESTREMVGATSERPLVFFGSAWKGVWYVPAGNSHIAALVRDAGGEQLFGDRTGSDNVTIDLETVLQQGQRAQFWGRVLAEPGTVDAQDLSGGDPRIERLPAFRSGQLFFANSARDDVFGQALLEPHEVLLDMVRILHPELAPDHAPRYFRSLGQ